MTILTMPGASGHALQTGALYLRPLTVDDLGQILGLHETVHRNLAAKDKTFLTHRGREAFQAMVVPPHHGVGIFTHAHELIAKAFLKLSHEKDSLGGLTDCPSARLLAAQCGSFAVPQSVAVHPGHRGKKLMNAMLDALEAVALEKDISRLVTEVHARNAASETGFTHHAYSVTHHDMDPSDGTKLKFLHKRLQPNLQNERALC